jgi:hypothetical protein
MTDANAPTGEFGASPLLSAAPVPSVLPEPISGISPGEEAVKEEVATNEDSGAAVAEAEAAPVPYEPTEPPGLGRIVHYMLSDTDAENINRRRTHRGAPVLGQAHVGNYAEESDVHPMLIVKCWGESPGSAVNGHVFLDGNDVLWVQSVVEGDGQGSWMWPQRMWPQRR